MSNGVHGGDVQDAAVLSFHHVFGKRLGGQQGALEVQAEHKVHTGRLQIKEGLAALVTGLGRTWDFSDLDAESYPGSSARPDVNRAFLPVPTQSFPALYGPGRPFYSICFQGNVSLAGSGQTWYNYENQFALRRQIVDAICAHDPDAAERAMLQHLENNRTEITYVTEALRRESEEE